jgi:hypothetical protein
MFRTWDSKVLTGLVLESEKSCLREVAMPDYAVYAASTSASTDSDELLLGGMLCGAYPYIFTIYQ